MGAEARSVVVRLTAETAQYIAQMQSAGRLSANAMKPAEAAVMRQSAAIDDLGGKAGKLGLVAAAGIAAMGKAAMDWESQFAGVEKTVDGTTSQLATLEGDLRGLAKTMPATHEEIAATAEAAGQLGVARDDITDFTKVMVEMGETTNMTADDAATSIAQFMNVMQTAAGDVDEIGNTIVDLGNKGASTEGQIVAMAQRVAGAGATIGATEADVLGLSAAMANLGIQSELGGGAIQRVLLGINTQVASGGDKLERYAEVAGTSAAEFAQAWSKDPARAFDTLVQGLGRIQDSGGDVASVLDSMGIKGTQNLQVMLRLAGSGDMLTRSLDQANGAWEENSALTEEFAKRLGTTAAEVQIAWNNIKDAGIEGGQILLPIVSEVAARVADMGAAFGALPDPIKDITTAGLALTAVFGGSLWFGAKLLGGIRSTKESLTALRPEITRVGTDLASRSGVRQFTSDLAVMATTSRTAGSTTARELARTEAAASRVRSTLGTAAVRGGALVAGLALATTDLADGMGLANTASHALMGSIAGPWGAAIGGGIGLMQDFRAASRSTSDAIDGFNDSLDDTDIAKMLSGFQALQGKAADLNADLSETSGIGDVIGDSMAGWADLFGDGLSDLNDGSSQAVDQLMNLTGVLQGVATANNDFIASASDGLQTLPYGDLDDLARIGEKVQPVLEDLGYSLEYLMSLDPGSAEAAKVVDEINAALAASDSSAAHVETLGEAITGLGNDMETTADKAGALADALDALLDPGMNLSEATDAWTTALRHLSDDLDQNSRTLMGNSDAAIKNRAAVRDRVGQIKDLMVAEAEAGASSDKLSRTFRTQRQALLKAGEAAGLSRKEMQSYLRQLGLTPDLVRTLIQADTGAAEKNLAQVRALIADIRDKTVTVTVNRVGAAVGDLLGSWGGGGEKKASGGPIVGPGTKTSDSVPILASNGEFMMSAAAVDHYGLGTMYAMNARRLASGGSVDGKIAPQGTLEDRLAIAQALQSIRDLSRDLSEVVKKGKHKGEHVLRGIDREFAQLQLEEARKSLKVAQNREKLERREEARAARQEAREAKIAISEAKAGLSFAGDLTPKSVGEQAGASTWDAITSFRDQIVDAGGKVTPKFDMLALKASILTARFATNAEKIEDLNGKIDSIRSAASGSLMHDPFAPLKVDRSDDPLRPDGTKPVVPPLSALDAFDTQVAADTNDTNAMTQALAAAYAKGLDGPLGVALAQSGNVALAEAFAGLDAAAIEQRERAYMARDTAGQALGQMAVQMSGFAAQVSTLTAENTKLVGQINALEDKIKTGVYQGAYDGTAQRERDRNANVAGRRAAGRR